VIQIKKFRPNKNYLEVSAYILAIVVISIIIYMFLNSLGHVVYNIMSFLAAGFRILMPFIYGFIIAFFVNVPVRRIEKIFGKLNFFTVRKKLARGLSVLISYILLLGGLTYLIVVLIPQLTQSTENLWLTFEVNIANIERAYYDIVDDGYWLDSITRTINGLLRTEYSPADLIEMVLEPVMYMFASAPTIITAIFSGVFSFLFSTFQIIMGLVVSIYMLLEKENFSRVGKKFLFASFKKRRAERIVDVLKSSSKIFENFFVGKSVESIVVGVIFYYICIVFNFPYPALLSAIIGVTNMIPFIGPFIGAVPVIIIVFLNDPMSMQFLWVALAILILQQIDGIIIGPKILGDSTGLSQLGVIFAIFVGGGLWGLPGMFFGVPLFAVLKNAAYHIIDSRYDKVSLESIEPSVEPKENDENIIDGQKDDAT